MASRLMQANYKEMNIQKRTIKIYIVTLILLGVALFVSLGVGKYSVSLKEIFSGTLSMDKKVFFSLRLPRVLMGLVAGFGLAFSGSIYQTLFRNPLASPDIIGVASGASAGAAVAILFFGSAMWVTAFSSFAGGFLAVLFVLGLTRVSGRQQMATFVIAGVAVNALTEAILMVLKLTADPEKQLASIEYWTMGSLAGVTDSKFYAILPFFIVSAIGLCILHRQITLLSLDSEYARMLGVSVTKMRYIIMVLATLMVGSVISMTGLIVFVGLMAPHLARMIMKSNRFSTMIYSGLLGGLLLIVADCAARSISSGEVPISIVTSFIGAPFLIYLICRKEKLA